MAAFRLTMGIGGFYLTVVNFIYSKQEYNCQKISLTSERDFANMSPT